jgi:hypothetical protein
MDGSLLIGLGIVVIGGMMYQAQQTDIDTTPSLCDSFTCTSPNLIKSDASTLSCLTGGCDDETCCYTPLVPDDELTTTIGDYWTVNLTHEGEICEQEKLSTYDETNAEWTDCMSPKDISVDDTVANHKYKLEITNIDAEVWQVMANTTHGVTSVSDYFFYDYEEAVVAFDALLADMGDETKTEFKSLWETWNPDGDSTTEVLTTKSWVIPVPVETQSAEMITNPFYIPLSKPSGTGFTL